MRIRALLDRVRSLWRCERWIDCGKRRLGDEWECQFLVASDVWEFVQGFFSRDGVKLVSIEPIVARAG